MKKLIALSLAYLFLVFAIIGIFLPGIPTVPFLLLSAWFASRGSEKLHRWLYAHPQFGSLLINWEKEGAVSRRSKVLAIVMMCGSWVLLYFYLPNKWGLVVISVIFVCVSVFLVTRPEPRGGVSSE